MKPKSLLTALVLSVSLLFAGCASGYKQFYKPATDATPEAIAASRVSPPPAVPVVERSQPGDYQTILNAYAKRGYSMVGYSMFNSGRNESENTAVRQGQEVGADLVLILNPKYTGSVTTSVPITTPTTSTSYSSGSATAFGSGGTVTAYGNSTTTSYGSTTNYIPITIHRSEYGAIFFVKRRFALGVLTRDLNDAERQELQTNKGAVIRVVVDGTPAFDADILVGDIITAIDGDGIPNAASFNTLLRDRLGKKISLTITRRGQRIEKSVQVGL